MAARASSKTDRVIAERLMVSPLFENMTVDDVDSCFTCSGALCLSFKKGDMIFTEEDEPTKLHILLEGGVRIGYDSFDGNRRIIGNFTDTGEVFGDILLFLGKEKYGVFAQATCDTKVIALPREFMSGTCASGCGYHNHLINNMLMSFARNAYALNMRLRILSCPTLRQKIAKMLLVYNDRDMSKPINMTREGLAEFLGVTRPSVSRELMKMQDDGLIEIKGRKIYVLDPAEIEALN